MDNASTLKGWRDATEKETEVIKKQITKQACIMKNQNAGYVWLSLLAMGIACALFRLIMKRAVSCSIPPVKYTIALGIVCTLVILLVVEIIKCIVFDRSRVVRRCLDKGLYQVIPVEIYTLSPEGDNQYDQARVSDRHGNVYVKKKRGIMTTKFVTIAQDCKNKALMVRLTDEKGRELLEFIIPEQEG